MALAIGLRRPVMMRNSLRFKVALFFSVLTIVLLVAQALGVRTLAEAQEEKLIKALILDDMASVIKSYEETPDLLPPFDSRINGYVSGKDDSTRTIALPLAIKQLPVGTHEIVVNGQEIHIEIALLGTARLYRVYNFSPYEKHFKKVINALMAGTGVFALLTIWLSFGLSGLLVRQVAGLARQVKGLRLGEPVPIQPGKYDETELVGLVEAFNDYHQRMSDMIEREKEFTGDVSHELRTPLTTIKTSCELLELDATIAGKSRARLHQIESAADNMRELANALLMLARGDSEHDLERLAIADMIETVLASFADRLVQKELHAAVDVDRGLYVLANRSALAIVLSNLVDNAVRHTDHGHIEFHHADGWLSIEDTGASIQAHDIPHVFDRFYRAGSPRTPAPNAGIGLSIVRKICDRHGWRIRIDSVPDKGVRVSLRLPAAE